MTKEYLGDSVYVEHDGFGLVITTENGEGPTNTICLEPAVLASLLQYAVRLGLVDSAEPPASEAYKAGLKAGVTAYAWWQDGQQLVGSCGRTLAQALADIDSGTYPQ